MLLERCMPKEENLKLQVEFFALETNKQAKKTVKDKKTLRGRPKMKDSYEDKYLNLTELTKAMTGLKYWGTSFGTTLWHRVQRYCAISVLFTYAQLPLNHGISCAMRRKKYQRIGSTKYKAFTRTRLIKMWITPSFS